MKRAIVLTVPIAALSACADPTGPLSRPRTAQPAQTQTVSASAFVCPPPSGGFLSITDLGALPGTVLSKPNRINNNGQAVGRSVAAAFDDATLWMAPGRVVNLSPPGAAFSEARDISDDGAVLINSGGLSGGNFIWARGQGFQRIPDPASGFLVATAMNDRHQVVGTLTLSAVEQHSVVWSTGTGFRDIGTLPGGSASEPTGINNLGEVVGNSNRDAGGIFSLAERAHAFLWTPGSGMQDLGTPRGFANSFATAINDRGEVAGYSSSNEGSVYVAWRWTRGSGFRMLGSLFPSERDARASDINNSGQVVGESFGAGRFHAVLWTESGDIQELPGFSPGDDAHAFGINDVAQIVGQVVDALGFRAVRWTIGSTAPRIQGVVVTAPKQSVITSTECVVVRPLNQP